MGAFAAGSLVCALSPTEKALLEITNASPFSPLSPLSPRVPLPSSPLFPLRPIGPCTPWGPIFPGRPLSPLSPLFPLSPAGPVSPVNDEHTINLTITVDIFIVQFKHIKLHCIKVCTNSGCDSICR
uniref:Uncharacterized protein n=1 Tax=Amphilophus citrinellus TaxID=61819 RepID=A0A3Q0T3V1_AMPCI